MRTIHKPISISEQNATTCFELCSPIRIYLGDFIMISYKRICLVVVVLIFWAFSILEAEGGFMYSHIIEHVDFNKVFIGRQVDVFFSQSDLTSIIVKTIESDRIDYIAIDFKDGELSISQKPYMVSQIFGWKKTEGKSFNTNIQVYITSPNIEQIDFAGNGKMCFETEITSDAMTLKVSNGGEINTKNLNIEQLIMNAEKGRFIVGDIVSISTIISLEGTSNLTTGHINADYLELNLSMTSEGKAVFGEIHSRNIKTNINTIAEIQFANVTAEEIELKMPRKRPFPFESINNMRLILD